MDFLSEIDKFSLLFIAGFLNTSGRNSGGQGGAACQWHAFSTDRSGAETPLKGSDTSDPLLAILLPIKNRGSETVLF